VHNGSLLLNDGNGVFEGVNESIAEALSAASWGDGPDLLGTGLDSAGGAGAPGAVQARAAMPRAGGKRTMGIKLKK